MRWQGQNKVKRLEMSNPGEGNTVRRSVCWANEMNDFGREWNEGIDQFNQSDWTQSSLTVLERLRKLTDRCAGGQPKEEEEATGEWRTLKTHTLSRKA